MEQNWDDERIKKALKGRVTDAPDEVTTQRVWAAIEKAVREGKRTPEVSPWWSPWGGGLRLAAAGLFLTLGLVTVLEIKSNRQQDKIASFMEAVTDGGEEEGEEEQPVRVSSLLTEPLEGEQAGPPLELSGEEGIAIEEGGSLL